MEAEIPIERLRELRLREGEQLVARPRRMRVFLASEGETAPRLAA
jgi:predicted Zn-dependent protease